MSRGYQRGGPDGPATTGPPEPAPPPPLQWVDPRVFDGLPIPPREWVVDEWLPLAEVTLLYADGGVGKTLLALQLAVALAAGRHWCGIQVAQAPVVALLCEDSVDEVHRRLSAINAVLGVEWEEHGLFRFSCPRGADNALVRFDRDGRGIVQPRLLEVLAAAKMMGARLVVIDTAADTFAGNENDRQQVRTYLNTVLTGFALEANCAVLVCAHPSRSGMSSTGDMDGGSTGWSNTARSRWAMVRPMAEDGAEPDENLRILTRRKANYARRGDEIELRWCDGVLQPARLEVVTGFNLVNKQARTDALFLDLLDRTRAQNVFVSASKNAGNYAPKAFAKRPDRDGHTRAELDAALQRLLVAGEVTNEQYGRPGDARFRLARKTPTPAVGVSDPPDIGPDTPEPPPE